jgi:hypothetical protein
MIEETLERKDTVIDIQKEEKINTPEHQFSSSDFLNNSKNYHNSNVLLNVIDLRFQQIKNSMFSQRRDDKYKKCQDLQKEKQIALESFDESKNIYINNEPRSRNNIKIQTS